MKKNIMLIFVLSCLDESSCFGGVDSVCQEILKGILEGDSNNNYFILGFNPDSNSKFINKEYKLSQNIRVKFYKYYLNRNKKIKIPNFLLQNFIIKREAKQFRPNIIHVHLPIWIMLDYPRAQKIITLHSYKKIGRKSNGFLNDLIFEQILPPICLRNCDLVTTVSKDVETVINLTYPKMVTRYIPNSLNNNYFVYSELERENSNSNSNSNSISIILTSNLEPKKRIIDGLKILKNLRELNMDVTLMIAGSYDEESSYYKEILEFINRYDLQSNVKILGLISMAKLKGLYKRMNIGLCLSEDETFGLAPLEMLAARLPVVVSKVGIFKWEFDEFKKRGLAIINPGDISEFILQIKKIIQKEDSIDLKEIQKFLIDKFSLNRINKEYNELYKLN